MSTLKEKAESILAEKNNKILSSKIKKDWQIFDIIGNYEGSGGGGSIDLTSGLRFARSTFSELPDYVKNANWEDVTDMSYMFSDCSYLTSISQLDTSSVTDMKYMFSSCYSLTSIPQIDTSSVTNMNGIFTGCTSLTTIPLLDTSSVTNMSNMFSNCPYLTSISQIDTSNVTNVDYMFSNCTSLTTIPLLDTSSVTDMSYMFSNCTSLTTIPLLDTSSVTNMRSMFSSCYSLTSISQLDTSSALNMQEMFYGCSQLSTIPQIDTSKVTNMENMFCGCLNLTTVPRFNLESANNVARMFCDCGNLQHIDLYTLNIDNIFAYGDMLSNIPQDCEIIVKKQQQKDWLLNNVRGDLTNIVVTGIVHNITINSEDVQNIEIGYVDDIIILKPIEEFTNVVQFNMNGNLISGNSFIMPDEDVVINNVVVEENYVIESEHNPYINNIDKEVFNSYISGASKLRLDIDWGTEDNCDILTISYHNNSGSTTSAQYSGGGERYSSNYSSDTIYTSDNYVCIHWHTDGSVTEYYGFKVTITKLDENGNEI